jgi:sucrose-6-phosphate hydrolase SacC (GH32 family)
MYFHDGIDPNEIGDFDVVAHDGRLHLFHLATYSHDRVGHLVSDSGFDWRPLPTAIHASTPGEFDGDQIWTVGVFRNGKNWGMLYTANQKRGKVQVTGLATSRDLIHWTKHKNPVARPDPRWYEAKQRGNFRVDWRDPHVVAHGGKLHAFVSAREKRGLLNHRGCAGYFMSTDGLRWTVRPPASTPRDCFDYECPSVFELNGRFYMVAIHGGHARMTYRVAERIEGPYFRPPDDSLFPDMNMAVRPCAWNGQTHLFHWNTGPRDWGSHAGAHFMCIASPKRVRAEVDGSLVVESCDWSALHTGPPITIASPTPAVSSCGRWRWRGAALHGHSSHGAGHWLTRDEHDDFELRAEVSLDERNPAREVGLLFRADETGDQAMSVRCIPDRGVVELVKQVHNRNEGPQSLWRGRSVVQSFHLRRSDADRFSLRLIAFGPNIELNVNGRLVISELSLPRRGGRVGLLVEDGAATWSNISLRRLRAPRTNWDW